VTVLFVDLVGSTAMAASMTPEDAVEALNYAVANGAKISNNSWGTGGFASWSDYSVRSQAYELLAYCGDAGRTDHVGWERRSLSRLAGTLIDGVVIVTPTLAPAERQLLLARRNVRGRVDVSAWRRQTNGCRTPRSKMRRARSGTNGSPSLIAGGLGQRSIPRSPVSLWTSRAFLVGGLNR
jgi:hypothetical protein